MHSLSEINIFFSTHYYSNVFTGTFNSNYVTLDADLIKHLMHSTGKVPTSKYAVKQLLRENDKYMREIHINKVTIKEIGEKV